MKQNKIYIFCLTLFMFVSCHGQNTSDSESSVRKAQFAGQFYPADKTELKQQVETFFEDTEPAENAIVHGIVSPHAGYVFSGSVAASAFNQVDADRKIKNVFLLGPAHRVRVKSASVFTEDAYQTPLGEVPVNTDIARKLKDSHHFFTFNKEAHMQEHSLEVQLPFLQYHLNNDFNIVPILVNTNDRSKLKEIASALESYYNKENLFVVSTDFSHYPSDAEAGYVDSLTARAAASGKASKLYEQVKENRKSGIKNLQTSMCGLSAMMVMLELVESNGHKTELVEYQNSADSRYGDKNRVVGYWAMRISENNNHNDENHNDDNDNNQQGFNLNDNEKQLLLNLARNTLEEKLKNDKIPDIDTDTLPSDLTKETGCFVTLHKDGELRGCIGTFKGRKPLAEGIQEMAISAALNDHRFSPVEYSELKDINIEISVLTPLKPISSLDEFKLGKHGIYIEKGRYSGTYLPQVAEGQDWTKEEFVSHCSQYKAQIGADGWKNADLFTYEALVFSKKDLNHE